MQLMIAALACLAISTPMSAQAPGPEDRVGQAVEALYAAFNLHRFDRAEEFTTEDWNHINPLAAEPAGAQPW